MPWSDAAGMRRNNLDLFRLILASGVLFTHSFPAVGRTAEEPLQVWSHGDYHFGRLCVDGFFAISGFLIAASWDRVRSLPAFLWHRGLRIYPAFFAMSLIVTFVVLPITRTPTAPPLNLSSLAKIVLDTLRFHLRFYEGAFPGNPDRGVNISVWTIPCEARCYAFVALLGVIPWLPRKLTAVLGSGMLIAACAIGENLIPSPLQALWREVALPSELWLGLAWSFASGLLLYRFRDAVPWSRGLAAGAALGLALGFPFDALRLPSLALLGPYLFFFLAFNRLTIFPDLARRYGDASYGAFLYGFPIQQMLVYFLGAEIGPYKLFAMALPFSLAAGWMSWHLIEKWFLAWKDRGPGAWAKKSVDRSAAEPHSRFPGPAEPEAKR